jgi:translation elongation factor P/translation initiation factor 5A
MRHLIYKLAATALISASVFGLASCTSEKKAEPAPSTAPQGVRTVAIEPGVAGGVVEDTFTVGATVTDVEKSSRHVTLTASDGSKTAFTAGPEIRNFDQLRVGDKVTATISERLVVFVRSSGEDPSVTHAAMLATAPKGAKPGAMVAETYEVVANVKAIDSARRTATLQFSDGQSKTIPVRSDVDLSRYKIGDSVVIRVTAALSVLVENP